MAMWLAIAALPPFPINISFLPFPCAAKACMMTNSTLSPNDNRVPSAVVTATALRTPAIDYWKNGGIRATAFNDAALLTCLSNDYGYEQVFAKPIEMMSQAGDLLIAISSSGRSLNILNGVAAARKNGCGVVTFSGFAADNPLRSLGNINFYVPSESYGYVEITHLSICHSILDLSVGLKGRRDPQD